MEMIYIIDLINNQNKNKGIYKGYEILIFWLEYIKYILY